MGQIQEITVSAFVSNDVMARPPYGLLRIIKDALMVDLRKRGQVVEGQVIAPPFLAEHQDGLSVEYRMTALVDTAGPIAA